MSAPYRTAVAELFKSKPHTWLDGLEIAQVGGVYAYRTRISEVRRLNNWRIENKVVTLPNGSRRSLYRYCPASLLEMAG